MCIRDRVWSATASSAFGTSSILEVGVSFEDTRMTSTKDKGGWHGQRRLLEAAVNVSETGREAQFKKFIENMFKYAHVACLQSSGLSTSVLV